MFTPSDKCPRRDACVQNGKGLIHMKDLTDKEGLYNHGRLFAHVTVDPGCSWSAPATSAPPATARSTAWRTGARNPWS